LWLCVRNCVDLGVCEPQDNKAKLYTANEVYRVGIKRDGSNAAPHSLSHLV